MPYLSSIERLAKEEGLQEGRQEGRQEGARESLLKVIQAGLQGKFGRAGLKLLPKIRALENDAQLYEVANALMTADNLDTIRALLS